MSSATQANRLERVVWHRVCYGVPSLQTSSGQRLHKNRKTLLVVSFCLGVFLLGRMRQCTRGQFSLSRLCKNLTESREAMYFN